MRIKRSVSWFIVICALLTVLVIWLGKKPVGTPSPPVAETNTAPPPSAPRARATASQRPGEPTSTSAPGAEAVPGAPIPAPPLKSKAEQAREGLAALNDEQVVFYGTVVDQFGAPVPAAAVAASIRVNNGTRVGVDRISLATDANGLFTITGYRGETLGVWATKEGYVMATASTSFVYSLLWPEAQRHNPDPNKPVLIKMWKLSGAEALAAIDKHLRLPYNGGPIRLDLLTGKLAAEGGDLKVTVLRPEGIISQQHPQPWSARLEIVDGGFISTSAEESRVSYAAPEAGYAEGGDFPNNNGPDLVDQMLFIKSRGGQLYSKLHFVLRINNTPGDLMSLTLTGVANTNGSRNWEATAPQ